MVRVFRKPRLVLAVAYLVVVLGVIAGSSSQAQQPAQRGEDASHFTGKSDALDAAGLRVTRRRFEAGARSAWHSHEHGQLLFVEEGHGRVQQRGRPVRELGPGDSDYTGPNVPHWHGAAGNEAMVQAALSFGGETKWMDKVTDAEYLGKAR